jgi:hypothetical protein
MESEHELYRTKVLNINEVWGDCILTNRRLMVKWDNGNMSQYLLTSINNVWSETFPPKATRSLRSKFRDRPNPTTVKITLTHDALPIHWWSAPGRELVAQIQKAIMPF